MMMILCISPPVRAAAVAALAKFGLNAPALRSQVITLLQRCLHDSDDEVRDRATLYLALLEQQQALAASLGDQAPAVDPATRALVLDPLDVPLDNLEAALVGYLDAQPSEIPFQISAVPKEVRKPRVNEVAAAGPGAKAAAKKEEEGPSQIAKEMAKLQELFARLGALRSSTPPVEVTEAETAYQVTLVKHLFERHVVFQYNVTNTIKEQHLKNVGVKIGSDDGTTSSWYPSLPEVTEHVVVDGGFIVRKVMPAAEIGYNSTEQIYAVLERPPKEDGASYRPAKQSFFHHLTFSVHDVDVSVRFPSLLLLLLHSWMIFHGLCS